MRKLLRLFWECFRISLFVVGGGYAILSVADDVFARLGWTEEGELIGQLPVLQMVPGLIAGNTAIYVGNKVAGKTGAAVALLAVALPSFAIFLAVSTGYGMIPLENPWLNSAFAGLRAALTGIIAAVIWRGWDKSVQGWNGYLTVTVCACILVTGAVNPVWVLLGAALWGLTVNSARGKFACASLPAIFLVFAKYGMAAFGGGYVLVPFYMTDFVGEAARYLQLAPDEFANVMALTQMTPGPIAINCATFFGYRLGGISGAGVATAALLLPSYLLLLAALKGLETFKNSKTAIGIMAGLKPAAMAMMICALISFAKFSILGYNITTIIIFIMVFTMHTKRKASPMTLIFVSALLATVAQADIVTTERYPDADAVILEQTEYTRYNPDGSYRIEEDIYVKVMTEKGRREESQLSLGYNRRYGLAEFDYVGVIDAEGKEREIDFKATMKETSDNSSMENNIYDSMARKLTCTIPGVQIGETVHIKYHRMAEKSRIENQFADMAITEWQCPILKATVIVDAPRERPLKKHAVRNPLENHLTFSEKEEGDRIIYKWETNYPSEQTFEDPDMPPLYTQVECVRYSTAADWQEISRWYWDISVPHLAKTTEAITNKVDEVGHDIEKLYKWVAQEIRYMGITMEETSPGYAPHDVDITFNNRYGVCRDKAALLVAMLRIAGFEAYPILIHNGAKQDPDVPMPYFNHAIACVKDGDNIILMDPTDESSRELMPSYLSGKSYLVATPEGDPLRTSPVISPKENALVINTKGLLEPAGAITFEMDLDFSGINDNSFRSGLVRMSRAEQRSFFQRMLKGYPGAELLQCEIIPEDLQDTSVPLKVRLAARTPDMMLKGEQSDEVTLPTFSRNIGTANWLLAGKTSLEKRKYPLVIDTTASIEEHLRIQMVGAMGETANLPADVEIKEPFEYSKRFRFDGAELTMDSAMSIGKVEFTPEEYYAIREEQKRIEASARDRVTFSRNGAYDASVRFRYWGNEIFLTGTDSWVETNRCVKEVLNYDGKKSSAELTFSYNPTWKTVELLDACVSNRNGQVSHVDKEKEINIMDASWASDAPRYPATQTMVVSLPSVEVGSVISYTTVTTVKNAPAEYYNYWCFDEFAPMDEIYVRCGDWERRVVNAKRLTEEQMLPNDWLWRDTVTISSNNFTRQCAKLAPALEIEPFKLPEAGDTVESIRNWMSRHVRLAGPALYEVPIEYELTDPATVVKERYANRLDYIRTMAAILKGAGFEAEVVFATLDGWQPDEQRQRTKFQYPNVWAFNQPIVRVVKETFDRTAWWKKAITLGMCERALEYSYTYLGLENEYTPVGATDYAGSTYFNPKDDTFNMTYGDPALDGRLTDTTVITVNTDNSVDMEVESVTAGTGVGAIRKEYTEMLPEERKRHFQKLLNRYSSAATGVGDIEVDIAGYPATVRFKCHISDYVTSRGDTITIALPDFYTQLFPVNEPIRQNPINIAAHGQKTTVYKVIFPEGYTLPERMPESYRFADPQTGTGVWYENTVSSSIEDGRLTVTVTREEYPHVATMLGKEFTGLLKDWSRIGSSRGNRSICVRKAK